eukprot:INCI4977.13.p1 GENE.INCI4977.13~~INCI4977.13.p1  ORF type:complete len:393 (-),score=99.71 INCI4977.13:46-1224(-)
MMADLLGSSSGNERAVMEALHDVRTIVTTNGAEPALDLPLKLLVPALAAAFEKFVGLLDLSPDNYLDVTAVNNALGSVDINTWYSASQKLLKLVVAVFAKGVIPDTKMYFIAITAMHFYGDHFGAAKKAGGGGGGGGGGGDEEAVPAAARAAVAFLQSKLDSMASSSDDDYEGDGGPTTAAAAATPVSDALMQQAIEASLEEMKKSALRKKPIILTTEQAGCYESIQEWFRNKMSGGGIGDLEFALAQFVDNFPNYQDVPNLKTHLAWMFNFVDMIKNPPHVAFSVEESVDQDEDDGGGGAAGAAATEVATTLPLENNTQRLDAEIQKLQQMVAAGGDQKKVAATAKLNQLMETIKLALRDFPPRLKLKKDGSPDMRYASSRAMLLFGAIFP